MKEIESIRNPQIQALRKLSRTRERREQGRFLVEGPRMAEEALAAGWCELVLVSHLTERNAAVAEKAEQTGIEVIRVSEAVMESLSENRTPQGILCVCRMPEQAKMPEGPLILALDAVQHPVYVLRAAHLAGLEDPREAGIDDGSRAAALTDDCVWHTVSSLSVILSSHFPPADGTRRSVRSFRRFFHHTVYQIPGCLSFLFFSAVRIR